jgi:hypothetical protein
MIPSQEKPVIIRTVVEKIVNEEMEIMYNFLKENMQGRIYRKPKDIEEFYEDIMYYFKNQQTRRYDQKWEKRLSDTIYEVAPDEDSGEWTTKQRIKMLKKEGIELEVYKRLTTKEANRKKEEEFNKMIKEKTKGMDPCMAYRYKNRIMNELYGEKKQPDYENEITMQLIDVHLKEEEEEIEHTKSLKWRKFKEMGMKLGISDMKRKVQKWLGREKSDIREKIEEIRLKYVRRLEEHRRILNNIRKIERKNQSEEKFIPLVEKAMERNNTMLQINYKDHESKILRNNLENYTRRSAKENRTQRSWLKRLVKDANYQRSEIIEKHKKFKEVFGLYGQVAHEQKNENPLRAMDIIF